MLNKRILVLVFLLLFLPLVGCLTEPNQRPIITSDPVKTATVGVSYTYDVEATDPDEDTLTYFLTKKPSGMFINSATGLISWKPIPVQIGDNSVIVTVSDGSLNITQSFIIKVSKPTPTPIPTKYYTITATAGDNGAIDPSGKVKVKKGSDKTFTITPDPIFYEIADVLVDGTTSMGPVSSHTFTNVTADHTISATFKFSPVYNQTKNEHYDNIQDAIDDAGNPGDTIFVAAGTYSENLVIDKSLYLLGASSATTIIDGGYNGNTVNITSSDVTLSGFTVTGGYADPNYPCHIYTGTWVWTPLGGLIVDGNGGTSALTGITIEDNIIHGNDGNGIFVSAAANVVIRNNEVYNNGELGGTQTAGISLTYLIYTGTTGGEEPVEWRRPEDILVENNNIYDNYEFGIYLCAAKDSVIRSNDISGSTRKGLLIASSMTATDIPSEYCTVEENEIHDNYLNGIKLVAYNHHNTFTGNTIYGNGFEAPEDRDDFKYGFLFQDGDNNILDDNIITGNALGGLYLWGKGDPSYTYYSTTGNAITGNTISDHTGYGIYIPANYGNPNSGFSNSTINENNIENNSTYGLKNADATQIVDATWNWWGAASGPRHLTLNPTGTGNSVSDNVDYIPWSTVEN